MRASPAWLLSLLLALASALAPHVAVATPPDLFGFGGETPGLAMTGVSYAVGEEAVFANPAGLAGSREREFVLGFHGAAFNAALDGVRVPIEASRGQSFGLALPLPFGGVLADRLALGLGLFTPLVSTLKGTVSF